MLNQFIGNVTLHVKFFALVINFTIQNSHDLAAELVCDHFYHCCDVDICPSFFNSESKNLLTSVIVFCQLDVDLYSAVLM